MGPSTFDFLLLTFFMIGMVLGYFRGAMALYAARKQGSSCLSIFMISFPVLSDVFSNSGDGLTAALGGAV